MPQTEARRIIHLHALAPSKPALGKPCNGCGVCCTVKPCPLGMWLSRRFHGPCAALTWSAEGSRYFCGAVSEPARWFHGLPARVTNAIVRRWIAAAKGCDSDLLAEPESGSPNRHRA